MTPFAILRTAKQYGIGYLLHKICANSKIAASEQEEFPVLCHFRDMIG